MEPNGRGRRPSRACSPNPFRGSAAIAAGVVSRGQLRGPRFHRLFQDVYVSSAVEPTLALRARGAYLLVEGNGVLGGYAAAELLGGSCGPVDAPVEVVVPAGRYAQPGLVVRQDLLLSDEVDSVVGVEVTSSLRTAFDLGRRRPLREAVVAVDALATAGKFAPRELIRFGYRHLGSRRHKLLHAAVDRARVGADSPMETRIRLAIVDGGLPEPVLQHPVGPYLLDLAYPSLKIAIEYDGKEHLTPARARHDLDRQAYLTALGWTIVRVPAVEAMRRPRAVAARVRAARFRAGRTRS